MIIPDVIQYQSLNNHYHLPIWKFENKQKLGICIILKFFATNLYV